MKTRKSYNKTVGDYAFSSFENMARANEMAQDFVTEALTGSYAPHIITYRGNVAIMSREPSGWVYSIIRSRSNTEQLYPVIDDVQRIHSGNCPASFDDCQRRMLNNLAQDGYIVGDTSAPDFIVGSQDRYEVESWFRWQNRYAEALSAGKDDNECRQYAHAA